MTSFLDDDHGLMGLINLPNMGNPHRLDAKAYRRQRIDFPGERELIIGEEK